MYGLSDTELKDKLLFRSFTFTTAKGRKYDQKLIVLNSFIIQLVIVDTTTTPLLKTVMQFIFYSERRHTLKGHCHRGACASLGNRNLKNSA